MSLLISIEDIADYEQMPKHESIIQRVQIRIKQAQDFDLPKVLPQALIDDMITNINSELVIWKTLYSYLRPVLVYFTYARFLEWQDLNVSSYGIEKVNTNYSQKLSPEEKEKMISRAKSIAHGYTSKLIDYLEKTEKDTPDTYVNWKTKRCGEERTSSMAFKIKAIG